MKHTNNMHATRYYYSLMLSWLEQQMEHNFQYVSSEVETPSELPAIQMPPKCVRIESTFRQLCIMNRFSFWYIHFSSIVRYIK